MTLPPKRILCVDDDADSCVMLEVFLKQAGYETVSAQNADEALQKAENENFNLFLLDLWLKNGEGIELCRRIRSRDGQTPIVIYSADARKDTQEKIAGINIQAFLVKPKGLDELLETIERLTASR